MQMLTFAMIMVPPVLVAVYTWNYGRWAMKHDLTWGGIGLYLLALLTVAAPALTLWWNS